MPPKTIYIFAFAAIFAILLPFAARAHQPRIVKSSTNISVEEPEISKAYYGELGGESATYGIKSDKEFNLYVGILVPDLPDIAKDKSFQIRSGGEILAEERSGSDWKPFYEKFSGDSYFQGPEFRGKASAGEYKITVSSPNNEGKYVLVIGETEKFPISEIVKNLFILPIIKSQFFGKPFLYAYGSRAGIISVTTVLVIIIVAYGLMSFFIKRP